MKHQILTLLKRPSTWLSVTSAILLAVVLFSPGLEKREVRTAEGKSALKEALPGELKEKEPVKAEGEMSSREEVVKAPEASATMPAETAGAVGVEVSQSVPIARAVEPIFGPPDMSALKVLRESWLLAWQGPPEPVQGPPEPFVIMEQLALRLQGPPDPVDITSALVAMQVGPPSPAGVGPPMEWLMDQGREELLEQGQSPMRGQDSEFAHGPDDEPKEGMKTEEAKVAGAGAGLQKPTTRITPPPSTAPPPVVAEKTDAEPVPPPLNEEPLPPAQGDVWKVVKVEGRDYVTGQSIQLFYRFSTHKVDGNHVWFRNPNLIIKGQVGSQELLVNNIKFILSYPLLYQGGQALFSRLDLCKLIEPVIRPSYIGSGEFFDTVVLDAGHGGHDSGAKGVYGYEKNYALAMVNSVREALIKRGFKVIMTRTNDTFLTLSSRVAVANRTPNSIFISIHFNSGGSTASGIETFALTPQGSASSIARGGGFSNTARAGNQFDSENIALATAVHAQVVHRFKLIDRGIKRARWTVLTGCNRPSILFEGGFVTNAKECQLIASEQYRAAVAEAIGDAVTNYRRALAPKPAGR